MDAFTVYKGLVAPLDRENVDTDAIIPKNPMYTPPTRSISFLSRLLNDINKKKIVGIKTITIALNICIKFDCPY